MSERNYKFNIEVIDEDNGEVVHHASFYSLESLEEKLYQVPRAIQSYENAVESDEDGEDDESVGGVAIASPRGN